MFYELNQIESNLECPHCKNRLQSPKCLPCGESICEFCIQSYLNSHDKQFNCPVCKLMHPMPIDLQLADNKLAIIALIYGWTFS